VARNGRHGINGVEVASSTAAPVHWAISSATYVPPRRVAAAAATVEMPHPSAAASPKITGHRPRGSSWSPALTGCRQLAQPTKWLSVTRLTPTPSGCRYFATFGLTQSRRLLDGDGPVMGLNPSPSPAGAQPQP